MFFRHIFIFDFQIISFCKNKFAKVIDRAVFPGIQGGPHNNITAAKAVCFEEAKKPAFKKYQEQVIKNAKVLAQELKNYGFNLMNGVTGVTYKMKPTGSSKEQDVNYDDGQIDLGIDF